MIKGFIFDFDGTLMHSEAVNVGAAKKIFYDLGHPLTPEEESFIPGKSPLDFIPKFAGDRDIRESNEHKALYEKNVAHYDAIWHDVAKIFPETERTVRALYREGKKLGIATASRRKTVEAFWKLFGLGDKFAFAVTSDDVTHRKPHPETYLLAVEKMGFPKEQCLAVEDSSTGLRAAKAAGLRCVVIPNEFTEHEDFSEADLVLSSLSELLKL